MKTTIAHLCLVLMSFTLAATASAQNLASVDLNRLLSQHEQAEMGLSKLDSTERAALQRWIAAWLPAATDSAHLDRAADRSLDAPRSLRTSARAYPGIGRDYEVGEVMKQGAYVRLEDGSLWEILSVDRGFVRTWLPSSAVTIVAADDPLGHYRYALISGSGNRAYAALIHAER
jgi:hypothetical protein